MAEITFYVEEDYASRCLNPNSKGKTVGVWFCVCGCVCICSCMHIHMQMHMHKCVSVDWPIRSPRNMSISSSPVLGFQANANTTGFVTWVLRIELEPLCLWDERFTYRVTLPTQLLIFSSKSILCHYCIQNWFYSNPSENILFQQNCQWAVRPQLLCT